MTNYEIKPGQSLFDIAVEVYGSVEGVAWLLQDNPVVPGPTGPILPGQILLIRDEKINARMVENLAAYAPFQTIESADMPSGIGFWKTEEYLIG